ALFSVGEMGYWTLLFPFSAVLRNAVVMCRPLITPDNCWHKTTWPEFQPSLPPGHSVEDGLGISVNFFHLDCLASEVRLNVDVDVTMTVLANGCYRWLATRLHGFDKAKPKQLYRKF